MDSLLHNFWHLHRLLAHLRTTTLVTATRSLEQEYRQVSDNKVAMAIAVHYLLLALRDEAAGKRGMAENAVSHPGHCRDEARRWVETALARDVPASELHRGLAVSPNGADQ
jgi:hypothetical protein